MPDASQRKINVYASGISSIFCSCGVLPFDNVRTKLQSQSANEFGELKYKGIVDCFVKSARFEGITGLWSGLPTFYCRVGPHAVITLLTMEALKSKFMK